MGPTLSLGLIRMTGRLPAASVIALRSCIIQTQCYVNEQVLKAKVEAFSGRYNKEKKNGIKFLTSMMQFPTAF